MGYGVVAVTLFGEHGDYLVESVLAAGGGIELRVLARRGTNGKRAKLIATVHLTVDEAHDLGWELRAAQLAKRWHTHAVEARRA